LGIHADDLDSRPFYELKGFALNDAVVVSRLAFKNLATRQKLPGSLALL